jgi:hypothetical protein
LVEKLGNEETVSQKKVLCLNKVCVGLKTKAYITILAVWKLVKGINYHQPLFAGSQAYALKLKIYVGGCGDTQAVAATFG